MNSCRPLRGLFVHNPTKPRGSASLHPRLYAIAALRGLNTSLHQLSRTSRLGCERSVPIYSLTAVSTLSRSRRPEFDSTLSFRFGLIVIEDSKTSGGIGLPNRKPWASSHLSKRKNASCSSV